MTHKVLTVASIVVAGAWSAAAASQPAMMPSSAPNAPPGAEYCMRVEAPTGSRIETVECWTRSEWAEQGVDVDLDWAREGVAVRG